MDTLIKYTSVVIISYSLPISQTSHTNPASSVVLSDTLLTASMQMWSDFKLYLFQNHEDFASKSLHLGIIRNKHWEE